MIFWYWHFQMWRKERVDWTTQPGWYRPCLLSWVWFTARNIFYSSSWNISRDKTKIFSHPLLSSCRDVMVRSEWAPLWCPPVWRATTPPPPSTRPLSTATKVRTPRTRLEPRPDLTWPDLTVFRWPQTGGLGRRSVPASSPRTGTAGPGISVREIQLLRQ